MLAPLDALEHLLLQLAAHRDAIPWRGSGLCSLVLELPPELAELADLPAGPGYLASAPSRHETRIGAGSARQWRLAGPDRLVRLRALARELAADWHCLDPDDTGIRPAALVAFAHAPDDPMQAGWSGLPNTLLWLPAVAVHRTPRGAAVIFNLALPADPEAALAAWTEGLRRLLAVPPVSPRAVARLRRGERLPDRAAWERLLHDTLHAIREGRFEKAVLARRLRVRGERPFDGRRLHAALAYLFPDCQTLLIRPGRHLFAAATPERLVCLRDGQARLDALAGTCPRAARPDQDAALGRALLASPKQRHEHELVVHAIRERLAGMVQDLEISSTPRLLRLSNVQHLWTPLRGRVAGDADLLSLAAALHPTPATGGWPREPALTWLRRREPFQRGWYTGAAGWLDPHLDGELWVLLRCALLSGDQAELYAGAGVTAGSEPAEEWRETESKLEGMLAALRYA